MFDGKFFLISFKVAGKEEVKAAAIRLSRRMGLIFRSYSVENKIGISSESKNFINVNEAKSVALKWCKEYHNTANLY